MLDSLILGPQEFSRLCRAGFEVTRSMQCKSAARRIRLIRRTCVADQTVLRFNGGSACAAGDALLARLLFRRVLVNSGIRSGA